MLVAFLLFAATAAQAHHKHFAGYRILISHQRGICTFWTGDVGLTAGDLKEILEEDSDIRGWAEIVRAPDTPPRCVAQASRIARRAGFARVSITRAPH